MSDDWKVYINGTVIETIVGEPFDPIAGGLILPPVIPISTYTTVGNDVVVTTPLPVPTPRKPCADYYGSWYPNARMLTDNPSDPDVVTNFNWLMEEWGEEFAFNFIMKVYDQSYNDLYRMIASWYGPDEQIEVLGLSSPVLLTLNRITNNYNAAGGSYSPDGSNLHYTPGGYGMGEFGIFDAVRKIRDGVGDPTEGTTFYSGILNRVMTIIQLPVGVISHDRPRLPWLFDRSIDIASSNDASEYATTLKKYFNKYYVYRGYAPWNENQVITANTTNIQAANTAMPGTYPTEMSVNPTVGVHGVQWHQTFRFNDPIGMDASYRDQLIAVAQVAGLNVSDYVNSQPLAKELLNFNWLMDNYGSRYAFAYMFYANNPPFTNIFRVAFDSWYSTDASESSRIINTTGGSDTAGPEGYVILPIPSVDDQALYWLQSSTRMKIVLPYPLSY